MDSSSFLLSGRRSEGIALAIIAQVASVFLVLRFIGIHAWDDGAITLAFSKTFAETGRIALTASSEQVEGFSSISWFLLNALAALFRPGFEQAIAISQLFAAAFVTVSLFFLSKLCRALAFPPLAEGVTLVCFAISGATIAETANGMEMTLLAASALALVHATYFVPHRALAILALILFVTTRFEAIFYLAFLLLPLWFRGRRIEMLLWAALGGAVFLGLAGLRWIMFSDILPNTIWAKMHEPYSVHGLRGFTRRIEAAFELPRLVFPLLLATGVGAAIQWKRQRRLTWPADWKAGHVDLLLMPVIAAEIFSFVSSKNWGYAGRMQFFALPFALLLIVQVLLRMGLFADSRRRIAISLFIVTIGLSWWNSARIHFSEMFYEATGSAYFEAGRSLVTPATFRDVGLKVEDIRQVLDKPVIVYMTPDVGGVGLCCSNIRVVDIAMLTNRTLARGGYGALPSVLQDERPDVIEVHEVWATDSKIYETRPFAESYEPLVVGGTRFYLRKDVLEKVKRSGLAQ
ncbi:hypothetical protein [Parvibaculum sp.]|uniref:hypothetical protein n=1 Tax=Parvibaculum sp. TaxID=2024848 RepID=UPI00320F7BA6